MQTEDGRGVPAQHVRAVPVAGARRLEHADRAIAAREEEAPARRVERHELREVDAAAVALAAAARARALRRRAQVELREVELLTPPEAALEARGVALHAMHRWVQIDLNTWQQCVLYSTQYCSTVL